MKESEQIRTGPVAMSARLETIVALAGQGDTVCDVGCDHAHVPIRLLQSGAYRHAIGMDVIAGPLGKAAGNLELYGMEENVELRLSNGLDAFRPGEAQTLVITGMGGKLMEEILLREPDKTMSFSALILGPQSDPEKVRAAVRSLGFSITMEQFVFEDGKYYPVIRAESGVIAQGCQKTDIFTHDPAGDGASKTRSTDPVISGLFPKEIPADIRQEAEDRFGPILLKRRDPVLLEFLTRRTRNLEKILCSVQQAVEKTGCPAHPDTVQTMDTVQTDTVQTVDMVHPEAVQTVDPAHPDTVQTMDTVQTDTVQTVDTVQPDSGSCTQKATTGRISKDAALRDRHHSRLREIEHDLMVFRAALTVYDHPDCSAKAPDDPHAPKDPWRIP